MDDKKREKLKAIIENYYNGNRTDFKKDIQKISKIEMLDLIEIHQQYGKRHQIINAMRFALES